MAWYCGPECPVWARCGNWFHIGAPCMVGEETMKMRANDLEQVAAKRLRLAERYRAAIAARSKAEAGGEDCDAIDRHFANVSDEEFLAAAKRAGFVLVRKEEAEQPPAPGTARFEIAADPMGFWVRHEGQDEKYLMPGDGYCLHFTDEQGRAWRYALITFGSGEYQPHRPRRQSLWEHLAAWWRERK